ncbi:ketosteroid isomerase-related protein [Hyphomonas sp.]|uniref:ketosteroid isomerase-related protein n=1 Tax=Hyphomonas sp. TaxID=87 RepID=UPI0025C587BD|nr:ketosteroid isomerase-related protein [Hyphomonas sp.]MBI1399497.1 isopropylmalate/homocitrate/citramalate synthase [Hyphomonas sp.]
MTTQDLIKAYYAAFNAKDWTKMAGCVAEDINHFVNEGDKRGGRKAFAEFIAHMDDCYNETLTDIVVMPSADGSRAAAEFIVHGIYKKTDSGLPEAHGQTYRLPAGAFFDVKDGAITRVTTYYNLKEWIRQVS